MSTFLYPIYWWLIMAIIMSGLWLYQQRSNDAGIADVGWSYGLAGAAIYYSIMEPGNTSRQILLSLLVSIWGIRLGTYLLIDRVIKAKEEDGRYQNLRRHFGKNSGKSFFIFFQGQAFFVLIFSIPFFIATTNPSPGLAMWDFLAIAIWFISIIGECIADKQLANFRSKELSKNTVCKKGLWKYSRHPSDFFEWLHWWSYVALSVGTSLWWVALTGPIFMWYCLWKVTGIPYTEAQALKSRGEAYRSYQKTTSPFFPWFPKESTQ